MSSEPRRACGYRKVGGLYLVADGLADLCDRLPLLLPVCETCGESVRFTKGFSFLRKPWWDRVVGNHSSQPSIVCRCVQDFGVKCPICSPAAQHKLGLMWVGQRFYTVESFKLEASRLGISKRIPFIPRGLEIGKTWVLLAHKDVASMPCPNHAPITHGQASSYVEKKRQCPACKGRLRIRYAGIFSAFRPQRIELIVTPAMVEDDRVQRYVKQGVQLVVVPSDDTDHVPTRKEVKTHV